MSTRAVVTTASVTAASAGSGIRCLRPTGEIVAVFGLPAAVRQSPRADDTAVQTARHRAVEACLEAEIPVLVFFWDDPAPYVEAAHAAGAAVRAEGTIGSEDHGRTCRESPLSAFMATPLFPGDLEQAPLGAGQSAEL